MNKRAFMGIAGAALAIGLSATGAFAQEVTLRMHQFLPPQANVPKLILDVWADKVEADSKGRIKIERYPSMQLGGKPPELMDKQLTGLPILSGLWLDIRQGATLLPKCLNCRLW